MTNSRYYKVALAILLIAAVAFVADVLSPYTPSPTALSGGLIAIAFACLMVFSFPFVSKPLVAERLTILQSPDRGHPFRHLFISLLCVLLC